MPRWTLVLLALAAIPLVSRPAAAQDDPASLIELRRELEAARAAVASLEAQREVLLRQLAEALAELAALKGGAPAGDAAPPVEVPADPFSCPDSLLAEAQRRYAREIAPLPTSTPIEARRRDEELARWLKNTNRELRAPARWLVEPADLQRVEDLDRFEATLTILDSATHRAIGRSFRAVVPDRFAARMLFEKHVEFWEATLLVRINLVANPERTERGVFDAPPFVGPGVEFAYSLDWEGLAAHEPEPSPQPDAMPTPDSRPPSR